MINFRVTFVDDSEHDVRVLPIDLRLTERKFNKTVTEIDRNPSIDETTFMIFSAMKRAGQTSAENLDDFYQVFADADRLASPKATKPGA